MISQFFQWNHIAIKTKTGIRTYKSEKKSMTKLMKC